MNRLSVLLCLFLIESNLHFEIVTHWYFEKWKQKGLSFSIQLIRSTQIVKAFKIKKQMMSLFIIAYPYQTEKSNSLQLYCGYHLHCYQYLSKVNFQKFLKNLVLPFNLLTAQIIQCCPQRTVELRVLCYQIYQSSASSFCSFFILGRMRHFTFCTS